MRIFAIVIAVVLPVMALAEQVVVRSGEHADFSRLVFEFQGPVDWEMGRVEKGYEIRVSRPNVSFDISNVFRRIPHDRVFRLDTSKDNTRITLELNCECHADAFEFRPGMLVIDVKDGLADSTSKFETAFQSGEISEKQTDETRPPNRVVDAPLVIEREEQLSRLTQYFRHSDPPSAGKAVVSDLLAVKIGKPAIPPTERVVEMQSEMLQQIGRAASQGLLDSQLSQTIQEATKPQEVSVATETHKPEQRPEPHVNMQIESSVDRAFTGLLQGKELTGDGAECLQSEAFNVMDWGNPDSIIEQITVQRGKIAGEFDKPDRLAVEALVKAYIYAGFGAEAQNVLGAFDVTLQDAEILKVMAEIVDGSSLGHETLFQGQAGCDSSAALWAVMAAPKLSKSTDMNHAAILRAYSSLPFHLRGHLGPALAQKFLDIDDVETARAIRNVIARKAINAGPEFGLLEARLDQERGLHKNAEQALEDIISQNNSVTPLGLIELLEAKIEHNAKIDASLLVTAQSYVFEQKGTKLGVDLMRVIALAQAKSGEYFAAIDQLRRLETSSKLDKDVVGQIWSQVLDYANQDATDEMYLRFIFAALDDLKHQKLSRKHRRQIAARLLDNGLAEIAQNLLLAPASSGADDRILLARAAIISNKAKHAIGFLEHVTGEQAALLRAKAYEIWGRQQDAGREYGLMPDQGKQLQAYWRAGDWESLGNLGSGLKKEAAKIMTAGPQTDDQITPTGDEVITQDKALIGASEAIRQTIEMLLNENPAPT